MLHGGNEADPPIGAQGGGAQAVVQGGAQDAQRDAFERDLTREILISERLRVTILAAIPGIALILFLAATTQYPEQVEWALQGEMDRLRVGLLLGGFATYELFALHSVERLLRSGREPPRLRRYLNALVEVSLPTLAIVYYMTVVSPVEALLLPPVFMYFVFILLSTLGLDFKLCLFTGFVAAVEYALLALGALDGSVSSPDAPLSSMGHHLGKAAILAVSGVAAGFVARRLRSGFVNTLASLEERNRVVNLFGQHVSAAVVDDLLARKAGAQSEVRKVCVMFLDIRNFTAFAEQRSPEEVVAYLNSVFEFMIESVNEHRGIVNKFLGDGFMAVFGAPLSDPDYCRNAVAAGLEIVAKIEARVASGEIPPTRVGIALHAGEAVVGNVGSTMRKEYTVIGDVVNVASRVEALNKELGSQLLVTERVWEASGKPTADVTPPMSVRGRKEPLRLFQLA
ncbi:adenylate/guanylate cyclase domain-containing protein [Chondromyces crocatus]|uniref:Adenylate cyclase n=1 Tax=Chondromyces crocatus TaxID=52 RepID=A0A0K1E8R2_CHOCO|nr:adenylate/guanylate cyclase domain-containing protein [Chondromyces crocatus]AKT37271.1 adenylate cyclase [Chondromyces crocatus]